VTNLYQEDRSNNEKFSAALQSLALQAGLELNSIAVPSIEEFTEKTIASQNPVKAVILNGHGNRNLFCLNKDHCYSGSELAKLLLKALKNHRVSSKLSFYFSSCLGSAEMAGKSLQNEFLKEFEVQAKLQGFHFKEVEVIAHHLTSNPLQFSNSSVVGNWVLRSRVPSLVNWFSRRFPNKGPIVVMSRIAPLLISLVGAVAFNPQVSPETGPPLVVYAGAAAAAFLSWSLMLEATWVSVARMNQDGKVVKSSGNLKDLLMNSLGSDEGGAPDFVSDSCALALARRP